MVLIVSVRKRRFGITLPSRAIEIRSGCYEFFDYSQYRAKTEWRGIVAEHGWTIGAPWTHGAQVTFKKKKNWVKPIAQLQISHVVWWRRDISESIVVCCDLKANNWFPQRSGTWGIKTLSSDYLRIDKMSLIPRRLNFMLFDVDIRTFETCKNGKFSKPRL